MTFINSVMSSSKSLDPTGPSRIHIMPLTVNVPYFILMIYLIVMRSQQIFSSAKDCEELNANLNHDLHNVSQSLVKNKLHHHSTKTKLMYVGSNHILAKIDHEFPVMLLIKQFPECSQSRV